ncbi:hypothetical protein LTR85_010474 [Meristemomyces frigidus]|nr:hypothetical protein LTR85_010474 [Meristemomyces frigidus]
MPRNWNYDIDSLREQVANTIATIKLEKDRLRDVQLKNNEELEFSDRNVIINWSRASISDFSQKLDVMEKVDQPSAEERQVMQQLTELVFLGDQIGDIQSEVEKRLDAKFGKVKWMSAADLPEGAYLRKDGKMVIPRKKQKAPEASSSTPVEAPSAGTQPAPMPPPPALQPPLEPVSEPPPMAKPAPVTVTDVDDEDDEEQAEEPGEQIDATEQATSDGQPTYDTNVGVGNSDPEGIYTMLGLTPEASMEQIKKGDPDAIIKLAQFMTLYRETLDGEEKRQAYDNITPDQLMELTKRVRELTVGAAPQR